MRSRYTFFATDSRSTGLSAKGCTRLSPSTRRGGGQGGEIDLLLGVVGLPEGEEDVGKAAGGGALQPDAAVLPVAEPAPAC